MFVVLGASRSYTADIQAPCPSRATRRRRLLMGKNTPRDALRCRRHNSEVPSGGWRSRSASMARLGRLARPRGRCSSRVARSDRQRQGCRLGGGAPNATPANQPTARLQPGSVLRNPSAARSCPVLVVLDVLHNDTQHKLGALSPHLAPGKKCKKNLRCGSWSSLLLRLRGATIALAPPIVVVSKS